jgi:catechol 2,3-dioxygenase-like lactoylglutathione lyase family enzyme
MVNFKHLGLVLLLFCTGAAQAQQGKPPAPPSAQVLTMSNIIHATSKLETTIAFYRDVFGLDAPPRAFPNPIVAALNNAPGVTLRLAGLKLPEAGFGLELTEFANFDGHPAQAMPTDPGAADIIFRVRDMDKVLAAIQKSGAPVVSRGGKTVEMKTAGGKVRSVLVRDPDGYLVQAIEVPVSEATASGTVQPGIALGLAVADMDKAVKFYRDLLGFQLSGSESFSNDKERLALVNAPKGAKVRMMTGNFPGSTGRIELYEYKGVAGKPFHLRMPDPGAPSMTLRVVDLDTLLPTLKAFGTNFESANGEPVQFGPTTRSIFVEDPNGLNIELANTVRPPAPKPTS